MKLKALLLIAALHFAALASCAGETAERPGPSAPDGNSGDTGGGTTIDLTGYRLIFADEFDGRRMNWDLWAADDPNNIKNETSRGPEAVEVRDGELRLNVRRVNRSEKVKWIAGYVYLKEPLENNVYIECRFRSGQCPGVNNAFWLACKTPPNTTWCNKYEVDIVEVRKDVRTGLGNGHLAYHDWKTYPYALDKNGNKCDIAAGISVKHSFEDYHIWGLWYGENEMIYYLDGQEMWRRKTSTSYPDQYYTGVGKAPVWNPLEEQRAYGKYGQEDWNYQAGYNGDLMHVILANIPWGSTWSPLVEEEADGTWMAVDYVRIYKPESLLDPTPETDLPHPAAEVELDRTYSLAEEGCSYFSTEITRKAGEELTLTFVEADGSAVGKVIVDTEGSLWSWWSGIDGRYMTVEGERAVIDAAAGLGYEYSTLDEGWESLPDKWATLRELAGYAAGKEVGLFVWRHWERLNDPADDYAEMRHFLDSVVACGVRGVKVDFMNGEGLRQIRFTTALLRNAAQRRLLVNFHGCQKPSGESRTYPNELTREGVRGMELNRITAHYRSRMQAAGRPVDPRASRPGDENRNIPACHNAALPFTRCVTGPADYTPVAFSMPGDVRPAQQLACACLIGSPLMTLAENPFYLLREERLQPAVEFLRTLPVCWDETVVLPQSRIGRLALLARRSGETWYLAAAAAEEIRESVSLGFLGPGVWTMTKLADDGSDGFRREVRRITGRDTLPLILAPGEGLVARFER